MLKRFIIAALLIVTLSVAPRALAVLGVSVGSKDSGQGQNNIGSSLTDQLNANIQKQKELQRKIADAQNQEKNLANEIDYLNNQISLTQLKIEESETRLTQLSGDIQKVTGQLESTKQDLDYTQTVAKL